MLWTFKEGSILFWDKVDTSSSRSSIVVQDPSYTEFAVSASYLEIYNEELTDLLLDEGKDNPKLSVVEDQGTKQKKGRGVFVMNLSEQKVENAARVLELMSHAQVKSMQRTI